MTPTAARLTLAALSAAIAVSGAPAAAQSFAAPGEIILQFRSGPAEVPGFGPGFAHGGGPRFDFSNGWRGEQVRVLAHELEDRSRAMRQRYREERPGNFFKQMLWAAVYSPLENLERAADRFHREVESRWQDPEDTWEAYQGLLGAFNDAAQAVRDGYRTGCIEGNWRETEANMRWLDLAYRHRRVRPLPPPQPRWPDERHDGRHGDGRWDDGRRGDGRRDDGPGHGRDRDWDRGPHRRW